MRRTLRVTCLLVLWVAVVGDALAAPTASAPAPEDVDQLAAQVLREANARVDRLKLAGELCLIVGRDQEAETLWRRALAARGDDEELSDQLAAYVRLRGDYEALIRLERRRFAARPTPVRRSALAEALTLAGRRAEAERLWMAVLAEGRWSEDAVERVVLSCLGGGRLDLAERLLKDHASPRSSKMSILRAEVAAAQKRYAAAARILDDYLRLGAGHASLRTARERWALYAARAGQAEKQAARLDVELTAGLDRLVTSYLAELATTPKGPKRRLLVTRLQRLAGDDPRVRRATEPPVAPAGR